MRSLLLLFLVACAAPPSASVSISASAVTLAQLEAIDLWLIENVASCDLVADDLVASQDLSVFAYQRVTPGTRASFPQMGNGVWLLVAEAYGPSGVVPIARGCVRVPPIYRDETTRVTISLEDAR